MMWTLDSAVYLIRGLQPICNRCYYNCCLYGSVLYKGFSNNDLDIQIIPTVDVDRPDMLIRAIADFLGVTEVDDPYIGLLNTHSVLMKLSDGKVLDIIVQLKNTSDGRLYR